MSAALTFTAPNGVQHTWTPETGFTGPLAALLNRDFDTSPDHAALPASYVALNVIEHLQPGVTMTTGAHTPFESSPEDLIH